MRQKTTEHAETTASRVKAQLRQAANAHPRAEYPRRFYSAEVRDGHRPGVAIVNVFCFHERERDRITKAIKNAVGKYAKVSPVVESMDGETGDWRVTFAA
jgi:hypothetical protein